MKEDKESCTVFLRIEDHLQLFKQNAIFFFFTLYKSEYEDEFNDVPFNDLHIAQGTLKNLERNIS